MTYSYGWHTFHALSLGKESVNKLKNTLLYNITKFVGTTSLIKIKSLNKPVYKAFWGQLNGLNLRP